MAKFKINHGKKHHITTEDGPDANNGLDRQTGDRFGLRNPNFEANYQPKGVYFHIQYTHAAGTACIRGAGAV